MYLKFENLQPVYFLPRPDVTAKRTFLWLAICASASLSTRCTGRDGTTTRYTQHRRSDHRRASSPS